MCADPMGMQWMMDVMAKKPKPTNTTPGLIYMLNGALQRSSTDPFDRTSPPIPIGPDWMILWPFDAAASLSPAARLFVRIRRYSPPRHGCMVLLRNGHRTTRGASYADDRRVRRR